MYPDHEKDFLIPVKLKSGLVVYLLEEDDADAVKAADRAGRPLPPPKNHRLLPFGQGVKEITSERFECHYRDESLGTFRTLYEALSQWDYAERYERFCIIRDREQAEIDSRYYSELTFDKDGYKVFKPRPKE